MIEKKLVYCEIEFLIDFLNSYPSLEPNDESLKMVDAWMSFYQFFCKANIILNTTATEFKSMAVSNVWLFRLWKKSTDYQCGLEFEKDTFPDISSVKGKNANDKILNSVFLTTKDDETCVEISHELGVFVFNTRIARQCNHLFRDNGTAFPDERAKDWSFMKGLNEPKVSPSINISNSMLIIDNYLLYDDIDLDYQQKMDYNLKPILQILLPNKLADNAIYEIVFFVGIRSEDRNKRDLFTSQHNYLQTMIGKIRKELKFKLSIFIGNNEDKFHDRSIVTNNVLINSGHGFGILRKGGKTNSPTSISIVFPFFQTKIDWCDGSYLNIMKTARKIKNRLHISHLDSWGDFQEENRLLSFYNSTEKRTAQFGIQLENRNEHEHQNGRIVGKIDLTQFENPRRNARFF